MDDARTFSSPLNRDDSSQSGPAQNRQVMSPTTGLRLAGETSGPDYGSAQERQGAEVSQLPNGTAPVTSTRVSGGAATTVGASVGTDGSAGDAGTHVAATGDMGTRTEGGFVTPTGPGARETATTYPVSGLGVGVDTTHDNAAAPAAPEPLIPLPMPSLPIEPRPTTSLRDQPVSRPADLPPMSPTSMSRMQVTTATAQMSRTDGEPSLRMQTMVSQQMVQELSGSNHEATAQTSVWSRVGEFFQKPRVLGEEVQRHR